MVPDCSCSPAPFYERLVFFFIVLFIILYGTFYFNTILSSSLDSESSDESEFSFPAVTKSVIFTVYYLPILLRFIPVEYCGSSSINTD